MTYQPIRLYGQSGSNADRLTVSGYYFVTPDGSLHVRKSITAFTAPKRYATGRRAEAIRYMDWWSGRGGNEIRGFSRVDWTGPPGEGVESGWEYDEAACEALLVDAAARGLHVEMVAHTGPYNDVTWMADHLRRVDELCLRHENALLEVWNEPQRNGGHELLEQVLGLYSPRTPGWASGCYDPTPYTTVVQVGTDEKGKPIYSPTSHARIGQAVTWHSPRDIEWSRKARGAEEFGSGGGPSVKFTPGYKGPVQLDEPPQVEQTIRDEHAADWPAEDDWRAYGSGCKTWGCGGTMHGNPDFQQCIISTSPRVLACVDAFLAGFEDVPTQRYHGYDRGEPPTPSNPGSRRYFRWDEAGQKYQLTIRPYSWSEV